MDKTPEGATGGFAKQCLKAELVQRHREPQEGTGLTLTRKLIQTPKGWGIRACRDSLQSADPGKVPQIHHRSDASHHLSQGWTPTRDCLPAKPACFGPETLPVVSSHSIPRRKSMIDVIIIIISPLLTGF